MSFDNEQFIPSRHRDTETLAEVLVRELTAEYGDEPEWTELGSIRRITRSIEAHFAARIVQARAGEAALREAVTRLADEWEREADHPDGHSLLRQTYSIHARDLRAALATADPS